MAKEKETTALTTTTKNYLVLKEDAASLRESLQANIGAGGIGEFDLDRLRVPAGGSRTWMVPGLEETEAKTVEGVIIHWQEPRAYWKVGMEEGGGGSPPDCSSPDSVMGTGDPGGPCGDEKTGCPLNRFGTAKKGNGKACKQTKTLFLLREDDRIPLVLVVPPGSLKMMRKFFLRLSVQAIPYYSIVTRFALESVQADKITYSRIVPSMVGRLEPAEVDKIQGYKKAMGVMFQKAATVYVEDVHGAE